MRWKCPIYLVLLCAATYVLLIRLCSIGTPADFYKSNWNRLFIGYGKSSNDNANTSCADIILAWCLMHKVAIENCSWTIGTFRNHFYSMASLISRPFPDSANESRGLALIRLGDGEMKLMFGVAVVSIESDHWSWPGGESRLGNELRQLIKIPKQKYNSFSPVYYGIYDARDICPFHELLSIINQDPRYLTYTNIFVNSNYPATKLLHKALIKDEKKKIILILNCEVSVAKKQELYEWAVEIIQYPHNGPLLWENSTFREEAIAKIVSLATRVRNKLFIFSVGPLSRVLIHHAWLNNPFNRYIDFGSTFDQLTKSKITRPYQSDTEQYQDPNYILRFNTTQKIFEITSSE